MALTRREISARYRARHLEQERARGRAVSKAHHAAHRTEAIAAMKARYVSLRETISAEAKAQRLLPGRDDELKKRRAAWAEHKEQRNAQRRLRRVANREFIRRQENARRDDEYRKRAVVRTAKWNREHPEHARALQRKTDAKRRAIEKAVFIEDVDPRVVFERDKGRCGICMQLVDVNSKWHVDHIIPIAKLGPHSYANVQLAHAKCNRVKGAKCA